MKKYGNWIAFAVCAIVLDGLVIHDWMVKADIKAHPAIATSVARLRCRRLHRLTGVLPSFA